MAPLYPQSPTEVPKDLTEPTRAYRLHAWLAVLALLLFVAVCCTVVGFCAWTVFRQVRNTLDAGNGSGTFWSLVGAVPPLLVCLLVGRGLFAVKRMTPEDLLEVTAADEPELFEFLHRVAKEAGAPKPHRVFLSWRVNASVFYDLSLLNLLLPSKKNLEIGLGLVNVLTLDELKAVIAHEFGHFAQRTMAVGRWVYTAHQIAGAIVAERGFLDRALRFISNIDLRIAWIGWLLRILVWAVRSLLDTVFRLVFLAKQALTREMELQADLVAVSLTGSDSLVHALAKLPAADEDLDRAIMILNSALADEHRIEDLFAVHQRVTAKMREVLDDPTHGRIPALPQGNLEAHRVFPECFATPPRMWSSHPPSHEREANVKRRYIASILDERSAWALFKDPDATRRNVTGHVIETLVESPPDEVESAEATLERTDKFFAKRCLDPRYRGLYLGRSPVRHARAVDELYLKAPTGKVREALAALYPERLKQDLHDWRELEEECATLDALHEGFLKSTANSGAIMHRGAEIHRRDLPHVIEDVQRERAEALERVLAHDRACRTAHRKAARQLGQGWREYLNSLVKLLHFADHSEANLEDAREHLGHVLDIVLADGRVSASERRRVLASANDLHTSMYWYAVHYRDSVILPEPVRERLELTSWSEALPKDFDFPEATEENLGDWLNAVGSWEQPLEAAFGALRSTTLDVLLEAEEHVRECALTGKDPGPAPKPARVPRNYTALPPGEERERQKRLDFWDRFQVAEGAVPTLARLAAACAVLTLGFAYGTGRSQAEIFVYNGLATPVEVTVGDVSATVAAHAHSKLEVEADDELPINAISLTDKQPIDSFTADAHNPHTTYVYNVAQASPLVEWTAAYGNAGEREPRRLGVPRFSSTQADVVFGEPPSQVKTKGGGATRVVLSGGGKENASTQIMMAGEAERAPLIEAHLRLDPDGDPALYDWLGIASAIEYPGFRAALEQRLSRRPHDVTLLRYRMDLADGKQRAALCADLTRQHEQKPESGDLAYLAARCIQDPAQRDSAFIAAQERFTDHGYLAVAAGFAHAGRGDWIGGARMVTRALGQVANNPGFIVELARARRRAAHSPEEAELEDLQQSFPALKALVAPERDTTPFDDPTITAYRALTQARFADALTVSPPQERARVLRFAAASEGATAELRAQAFALAPAEGISMETLGITVALATREQRDTSALLKLADQYGPEFKALLSSWTDPKRLAEQRERLESELTAVRPQLRGLARAMGIVLLDGDVPQAWRDEVRCLLFARERPYFLPARLDPQDAAPSP